MDSKRKVKQYPGLFQCVIGMTFFGTPFRGAPGMKCEELLSAAYHVQQHKGYVQGDGPLYRLYIEWILHMLTYFPERTLRILEPDNEALVDLMNHFMETRQEAKKAKIACFYELKPTNVGAIIGDREIVVCIVSFLRSVGKSKVLLLTVFRVSSSQRPRLASIHRRRPPKPPSGRIIST